MPVAKYLSSLLGIACLASASASGALIITAVYDGSGSTPKGVELYVTSTGSYNGWTLDQQFNANTTWTTGYAFDATVYTVGEFILVTSTGTDPTLLGSGGTIVVDGSFNSNGDDRVRLTDGTTVIDQHGVTDVDGTGAAWEFLDSWASRNSGTSADGSFNIGDWSYGGPNALDAGNGPLAGVLGSYVIPEPATSLLGGLTILFFLRRIRRA